MSTAYERAGRYLHLLSEKSGGRFFYAGGPKSLREVFAGIAQELRQQYSLAYYPSARVNVDAQSERKLSVKVDAPKVSVRARKAFVYKQRSLFTPALNYRISAAVR